MTFSAGCIFSKQYICKLFCVYVVTLNEEFDTKDLFLDVVVGIYLCN